MSATLHAVALDVWTDKEKTAELKKNAANAMQERLTEADGRMAAMEDTSQQLANERDATQSAHRHIVEPSRGFSRVEGFGK